MSLKNWRQTIPEDFPDTSRVWIYQSNTAFSSEQEQQIAGYLDRYITGWMSHGRPVKGWAAVLFHRFIVIVADDASDKLCGSAIDGSIRFIKEIETKMNLELMNRMNLGFVVAGELTVIPMSELEQSLQTGKIDEETIFFNNAVSTKKEFLQNWLQPLKESFLAKKILN